MSIFNTPARPRATFRPHSAMEVAIFGVGLVAAIMVGVIASGVLAY